MCNFTVCTGKPLAHSVITERCSNVPGLLETGPCATEITSDKRLSRKSKKGQMTTDERRKKDEALITNDFGNLMNYS